MNIRKKYHKEILAFCEMKKIPIKNGKVEECHSGGGGMKKYCKNCQKLKDIKDFYIEKKRYKNKRYEYPRFQCRECDNLFLRNNYPRYKLKIIKSQKEYFKNNPWLKHYFSILQRCQDLRFKKYYGKINNFLTMKDIKVLWFKYKAYQMERPHIHRVNSDGHYTFKNCIFLEAREHSSKKIFQLDSDGKVIKKFNSISEAAESVDTVISNISNALTGRTKKAKQFMWEYA